MTASPLPQPYAGWIESLLGAPVSPEPRATCDHCAMALRPGQTPRPDVAVFDRDAKCCTFYPELANFRVGSVIEDTSCNGRDALRRRFTAGLGVTPLKLERPAMFGLLYHGKAADAFGRSRELLCPFYEKPTGRCGIWAHRESVCSTYYCKFARGAAGMRFWRTLQSLLAVLEREISLWCVLELDIGEEALERLVSRKTEPYTALTERQLAGKGDPAELLSLWGRWAGREVEFYRRCAQLVGALSWTQAETVGGSQARALAQLLRVRQRELSSPPPERVRVGAFQVSHLDADMARVRTYNPIDPLELPAATLQALPALDDRPIGDAVAALGADVVQTFLDFELLVPADRLTRRTQ